MEKPKVDLVALKKLVFEKNAFDQLEPLKDPTLWDRYEENERELLAELFLMQGANQLQGGNLLGLETCDVASQIAPQNPRILYQHAVAYITHGNNLEFLRKAIEVLDQVIDKEPNFWPAYFARGEGFKRLGIAERETAFLQAAIGDVQKAADIQEKQNIALSPEFLWEWGVLSHLLGKNSGEPSDFFEAIAYFQRAYDLGFRQPAFFADFGFAHGELGYLLHRDDLLIQSSVWFQRAYDGKVNDVLPVLLNWAAVEFYLFLHSGRESHFRTSQQALEAACTVDAQNPDVWLKWGQLLLQAGKMKRDLELVQKSIEKFEKASNLKKEDVNLLSYWGEALMTLGGHLENIDFIQEAEEKIGQALMFAPDQGFLWYLSGHSAIEKGHYFQDSQFFSLAIERFQSGLMVDEANPRLWQGMASACYALGDASEDRSVLEKATQLFSRVIEFDPEPPAPFWNEWGLSCMKLGELSDSKEWVNQAIEKFERAVFLQTNEWGEDSVDSDWYYNWGCALELLGDLSGDPSQFERAIQLLSKAALLDPQSLHVRQSLALALAHLGELIGDIDCLQKACELFEQLIVKEPEEEHIWNEWGVALLNYGLFINDPAHTQQTEHAFRAAEQRFIQAARLGNSVAYYHLACHAALTERLDLCIHYLEKADSLHALPHWSEIEQDDWLKNVLEEPSFKEFIEKLKTRQE